MHQQNFGLRFCRVGDFGPFLPTAAIEWPFMITIAFFIGAWPESLIRVAPEIEMIWVRTDEPAQIRKKKSGK